MHLTTDTDHLWPITWFKRLRFPATAKAREAHLLAVLTLYANREGGCFPSIKTLASRMRCSERAVKRALAGLVKQDLVEVCERERRGKPRGRAGNQYYLPIEQIDFSDVQGDTLDVQGDASVP